MAHTIVEVVTYTPSVVTPDDGDDASAASLAAGLQPLANRTAYLLANMPNGFCSGAARCDPHLDSGGVPDGVHISSLDCLIIGGVAYAAGQQDVLAAAAEAPGWTGASGQIGWWYLYAKIVGGAVVYLWSLTGPDGTHVWRSGAVGTQRYMGMAVYSAASGNCDIGSKHGPLVSHVRTVFATAVQAITPTIATLNARSAPVHVRCARIHAQSLNVNATQSCQFFADNLDNTSDGRTIFTAPIALAGPLDQFGSGEFMTYLNSSHQFYWHTTNDGAGMVTDLACTGWLEDR